MIRCIEFSSTKPFGLLIKSNLSHKFSQTFNRFHGLLIINQNINYKLNNYRFTNLYNVNSQIKNENKGSLIRQCTVVNDAISTNRQAIGIILNLK